MLSCNGLFGCNLIAVRGLNARIDIMHFIDQGEDRLGLAQAETPMKQLICFLTFEHKRRKDDMKGPVQDRLKSQR